MMSHQELVVIGIIVLVVLIIILFSMLYSPAQYNKLSELYHEQKLADDLIYEGINTSKFRYFWFKITNKNVNHYYG